MNLKISKLKTPCYVYSEDMLVGNIQNVKKAFKSRYSNFQLAYSYKTNYANCICSKINELGCYSEVVSDMEYEHAISLGVKPCNIIFNGPCKDMKKAEAMIEQGVKFHIDNIDELLYIEDTFKLTHPVKIGVRLNFDIGVDEVSRFGIDVTGEDFVTLLNVLMRNKNLKVAGIHCHISHARDLESWKARVATMLHYAKKFGVEYVDLGSNMYSEMEESLAKQYADHVPSFDEYAEVICSAFSNAYRSSSVKLILELGTPIVARAIGILAKVENIRQVRGKTFITMNCSKYSLGAIAEVKNVPIQVVQKKNAVRVNDAVFVGNTCVEHDVLHAGFTGEIGVGSKVLFTNCGAYSLVNQPHFINPAIGMIKLAGDTVCVVYKPAEYDDVFGRFIEC